MEKEGVQSAAPSQPVLLAAGSLRDAMNEILRAWQNESGQNFAAAYGPSGKLRQEIEAGRRVDVFASASVDHTDLLKQKGLLNASLVFAHNDLCVVSTPALGLDATNLLEVLARPDVRVATSTPVSDPMGDYTWQFFRNAEEARPGMYELFDRKALKLSGARAPLPGEKLPYVTAFEDNRVDAYIMYCTNAVSTRKSLPRLSMVRIPARLNVRSTYGIGAHVSSQHGQQLVRFIASPDGRTILDRYGFN